MLECKLAQGKGEVFVQDVKAAPEPQSILFYEWQADDLVRFCTNNHKFSVLTVDTTFNLGDFFVTPMTYHHLMLEDVHTRNHPIMVGPMLVHQRMQFSTFNYFASTLIGYNKSLRNILAFGTDGDKNMTEALGHNFPFALQLRCFLHFKKNVEEKLRDLAIPHHTSQMFLDDIFGKSEGNVRMGGLVDASSVDDFDHKLDALEQPWNTREAPYAGQNGPQFYNHFKTVKANVVRHHMRKDIREAVGLGSPPAIFTTNSSEALNSVLKKQVSYKKTQWPEFVQQMKALVDAQRNEVIRSLSGRGRYRLAENCQHLGVSMEEWSKMRPDQRRKVVQKFESVQLPKPSSSASSNACSIDQASSSTSYGPSSCSVKSINISAEESGIHTIPLVTLQAIWSKADSLLKGDNTITPAPGADRRARCVISYHSDVPHIVRPKGNGQYACDTNCPQWVSSKICSHSVAVAQLNSSLGEFLEWYTACAHRPNLTALAVTGMPSGRGRKKNQMPRSRAKPNAAPPDAFVVSPPSLAQTPTAQLPATSAPPAHLPGSSPPPLVFVGQSNNYTSPLLQPNTFLTTPAPVNMNPFYIKFITGNIRICHGCRSSLCTTTGMVPNPPYDITIARAERRPYRDVSGNLVTPQKETAAHYHVRIDCVKAADPNFVPMSLHIPSDIYSQLNPVHREYLSGVFELSM